MRVEGIGGGQAHVFGTFSIQAPQHLMPSMPDGIVYTTPYLVLAALLRYPSCVQIEKDEDGEEVVLGHGQFGQVVKGRYRLAPVAVKRLTNQTASERAAFIKEMAILRACRGSRYIVPFVGASLQKVISCPVTSLQLCLCASVGRSLHRTARQESQHARAQGKVRLPGWPAPMQLV